MFLNMHKHFTHVVLCILIELCIVTQTFMRYWNICFREDNEIRKTIFIIICH